jgi:hypothetical protein
MLDPKNYTVENGIYKITEQAQKELQQRPRDCRLHGNYPRQ